MRKDNAISFYVWSKQLKDSKFLTYDSSQTFLSAYLSHMYEIYMSWSMSISNM